MSKTIADIIREHAIYARPDDWWPPGHCAFWAVYDALAGEPTTRLTEVERRMFLCFVAAGLDQP